MNQNITETYNKLAQDYVNNHGYNEHLTIPSLKEFLTYLEPNSKILDVGCGGGQDAKFLSDNGCKVAGIDISEEMIKIAKQYDSKTKYKIGDVMELNSKTKYNGIWCCRVFHHVNIDKQEAFLDKLNKLLKNDGALYLTAFVSDNGVEYESYDSGNENLLKKRNTEQSLKKLLNQKGFIVLNFNYWSNNKGMEFFVKKIQKNNYYLYILECSDGSLYTGITTDIERRLFEHNNSKLGARYTSIRRPVRLIYFAIFENRSLACKEEYRIKQLSREEKLKFIKN